MESVITIWYLMLAALKVKRAKLHNIYFWSQAANDQIVTLSLIMCHAISK